MHGGIKGSAAAAATDSAVVEASAEPGGKLALTISGPPPGWLPGPGLSQRLIRAYADQLGTAIEELDGGAIRLVVSLASEKPTIGMRSRTAA